ncbi:response regulator, partial [bacterium]|nr:response regulator [bacterium]
MAAKASILWVDDEIEMLRPHIIFLEQRGYQITPVPNAEDAISMIREQNFDLVLLDEMLTGMDGLTALNEIKDIDPGLPVVMVTKSEEESLMEDAIGGRIDDYLVKPVNPSQILMTIRKNLDSKNIEADRLSRDYSKKLNQITMKLMNPMDDQDWIALYYDLCSWEVELDQFPDLGMRQTITDQKRECNVEFAKFIERNYRDWLKDNSDGPVLSTDIVSKFVIPQLEQKKSVVFLVIDNLRLDQWMAIENLLYPLFNIKKSYYYSILPTATPYSRNAIFSGLFPEEIREQHPEYWKDSTPDDET